MKATIRKLEGKYYGTTIDFEHKHGSGYFTVWFMGNCKPSKRQLKHVQMNLKEWNESDYGCDGHFESKDCYEMCEILVDALNGEMIYYDDDYNSK